MYTKTLVGTPCHPKISPFKECDEFFDRKPIQKLTGNATQASRLIRETIDSGMDRIHEP